MCLYKWIYDVEKFLEKRFFKDFFQIMGFIQFDFPGIAHVKVGKNF